MGSTEPEASRERNRGDSAISPHRLHQSGYLTREAVRILEVIRATSGHGTRSAARAAGVSYSQSSRGIAVLRAAGLIEVAGLGARGLVAWKPAILTVPDSGTVPFQILERSRPSPILTSLSESEFKKVTRPQAAGSDGGQAPLEPKTLSPAPTGCVSSEVNPDLRSMPEEQEIAVRALLALPRWLQSRTPIEQIRETQALVAAYSRTYHPRGVFIWIEIAQRGKERKIQNPTGWVYDQLRGYGLEGRQPRTRTGKPWKWVAAVLAGDRDLALKLLERAEGKARGERRQTARYDQARRQQELPLAAAAAPAPPAGAGAPRAASETPEHSAAPEAPQSLTAGKERAELEESRAWLEDLLGRAADPEWRKVLEQHLGEVRAALAGCESPPAGPVPVGAIGAAGVVGGAEPPAAGWNPEGNPSWNCQSRERAGA